MITVTSVITREFGLSLSDIYSKFTGNSLFHSRENEKWHIKNAGKNFIVVPPRIQKIRLLFVFPAFRGWLCPCILVHTCRPWKSHFPAFYEMIFENGTVSLKRHIKRKQYTQTKLMILVSFSSAWNNLFIWLQLKKTCNGI